MCTFWQKSWNHSKADNGELTLAIVVDAKDIPVNMPEEKNFMSLFQLLKLQYGCIDITEVDRFWVNSQKNSIHDHLDINTEQNCIARHSLSTV